MFTTCGSSRKEYVHPADISYQNVPGFYAAPDRRVSEWSAVDDDTILVTASLQAPGGLRLRWLGTAGFELSDDSTTILIDPFVSRPSMPELAQALIIDTAAVNRYVLAPLRLKHLKAILISHPHHDHFQDVPYILAQFPDPASRPVVIGGRNVFQLLQGYSQDCSLAWVRNVGGLHNTRVEIVEFTAQNKDCLKRSPQIPCLAGTYGDFSITAFGSDHPSYDYLPGVVIDGDVSGREPYRATEYKTWLNTSIGFLVEYRDLRFFFSESPIVRHADQVGRVDVLIQGIASRKDCDFIANTMAAVQPRYVIPTHYDDFFKPLTEFQNFDAKIGEGPLDFSRFEDFVYGYEGGYAAQARALVKHENGSFDPQLRLLKLFYYYSLEKLVRLR
ncbi:MAG: MBL fold metallo-hydrolase [bacterium]